MHCFCIWMVFLIWARPIVAATTITNTTVWIEFETNQTGKSLLVVWSKCLSTDGQSYRWDYRIAAATALSTVCTNRGGYFLALCAPTNCLLSGTPFAVWLAVANASTNAISGWHAARQPKNFGIGELLVTNMATGASMPFCGNPIPMWVSDNEVQAPSPGQTAAFDFHLGFHYGVRQPGRYAISFRAKLPSPYEPGKEVCFETPPLILTLLATNGPEAAFPSGTNGTAR